MAKVGHIQQTSRGFVWIHVAQKQITDLDSSGEEPRTKEARLGVSRTSESIS